MSGVSYNPDDHTPEARTADALERIADTLDDFIDMSLTTTKLSQVMQGDPAVVEALRPLTDALQAIADRRASR